MIQRIVVCRGAGIILNLVTFSALSQSATGTFSESSSDQLETIVVTAERREENLQKVPLSVSAFSERDLKSQQIGDISDLTRAVPGVQVTAENGTYNPFIRGLGTTTATFGNASSVAIYEDGIYFARAPAGYFATSDLERVEVLKGPQGTLFGRSTTGGVIQYVTKNPSQTPGVDATVSYGNFGTFSGDVYANTGITQNLAADFLFNGNHQNQGYGFDASTGRQVGYLDYYNFRSKWVYTPFEGTSIVLTGFYSNEKTTLQGNTYPGTTSGFTSMPYAQRQPLPYYDQDGNYPTYDSSNTWGVFVKFRQDLSFAQFTSISAYINTSDYEQLDSDNSPRTDKFYNSDAWVNQFTQEFQLGSREGGDLSWITGLYYYNTSTGYPGAILAGPYFPNIKAYASQLAKSYAGYGQVTYKFAPRWNFTAGLRYTRDDTDAHGSIAANLGAGAVAVPPPASIGFDKLTYRGALDFAITDQATAYASVSSGYKAGNFNLLTYSPTPTRPELMTAYEVGVKADLLDEKLRLNAASFYYKNKNPQVFVFQGLTTVLSNAQGADSKGLDFDAQAVLSENFTVRMSYSYLDAKYTAYTGAPSVIENTAPPFGGRQISIDATGNVTPFSPKNTFDVGFDYKTFVGPGKLTLSVDLYHNSGFFYEANDFLRQSSFSLLNAQAAYAPNQNFNVRLWGKNLENKEYSYFATSFANAAGFEYIAAPPRTYGITFEYKH